MLAAYGIPSAANAFWHVWNNWMVLVALGGVEVQVFEHDAEAAGVLAEPVETYEAELESEVAALKRSPFHALIALFFLYYFGAPAPLWIKRRRFLSEERIELA